MVFEFKTLKVKDTTKPNKKIVGFFRKEKLNHILF